LNKAVRADPMCNVPVGDGAKRVTTEETGMILILANYRSILCASYGASAERTSAALVSDFGLN